MVIIRQKEFGLWGDILKGAIKGAAGEVSRNNPPSQGEDIIFGTLMIDWCIDKGRYIGKDWTYTVKPDCSVEANNGKSIISWDLSENFKPLPSCPQPWSKFTIKGVAKDGDYLPATIILNNGSERKGKVLVEVSK